jgi:drug/metabolite transporter (DMT)-like permease
VTTGEVVRALKRPESTIGLGIAMMVLGDFLFATNDVMGKWLVATYSVGQLLLIRSLAALVILLPMVARAGFGSLLRLERPGVQLARVVFATLEVICFYWAVIYLPVADVMTFYLAGPIYVAALSPLMLGERVGWRRWTAIVVGFAGVVIALQPSAETLSLPAIISIVGSLMFALMVIQGRQLRGTPDATLVFWQTLGALVAGAVVAPWGWVTPTAIDFGLLSLLGVVAMLAHICINRALKLAPAVVVAPIQYTLLLWAIIYGYFVFGDVPDPTMLVGAAVIIGAGIFIFWRENKTRTPISPPGDLV